MVTGTRRCLWVLLASFVAASLFGQPANLHAQPINLQFTAPQGIWDVSGNYPSYSNPRSPSRINLKGPAGSITLEEPQQALAFYLTKGKVLNQSVPLQP